MKVHTEYLTFKTRDRYEMVHITPQIEAIVRKSGVDDGLCFVSPMHITAATSTSTTTRRRPHRGHRCKWLGEQPAPPRKPD